MLGWRQFVCVYGRGSYRLGAKFTYSLGLCGRAHLPNLKQSGLSSHRKRPHHGLLETRGILHIQTHTLWLQGPQSNVKVDGQAGRALKYGIEFI